MTNTTVLRGLITFSVNQRYVKYYYTLHKQIVVNIQYVNSRGPNFMPIMERRVCLVMDAEISATYLQYFGTWVHTLQIPGDDHKNRRFEAPTDRQLPAKRASQPALATHCTINSRPPTQKVQCLPLWAPYGLLNACPACAALRRASAMRGSRPRSSRSGGRSGWQRCRLSMSAC